MVHVPSLQHHLIFILTANDYLHPDINLPSWLRTPIISFSSGRFLSLQRSEGEVWLDFRASDCNALILFLLPLIWNAWDLGVGNRRSSRSALPYNIGPTSTLHCERQRKFEILVAIVKALYGWVSKSKKGTCRSYSRFENNDEECLMEKPIGSPNLVACQRWQGQGNGFCPSQTLPKRAPIFIDSCWLKILEGMNWIFDLKYVFTLRSWV